MLARLQGAPASDVAKANDYAGGAAAGGVQSSDYAHLPPLQRKVMEVVSAEEHEDGMHVSNVSRFCGNATAEAVMWVLVLLCLLTHQGRDREPHERGYALLHHRRPCECRSWVTGGGRELPTLPGQELGTFTNRAARQGRLNAFGPLHQPYRTGGLHSLQLPDPSLSLFTYRWEQSARTTLYAMRSCTIWTLGDDGLPLPVIICPKQVSGGSGKVASC